MFYVQRKKERKKERKKTQKLANSAEEKSVEKRKRERADPRTHMDSTARVRTSALAARIVWASAGVRRQDQLLI
jgi:hypothetical protein